MLESNFEFVWPWIFSLAPLPILIYLLPAKKAQAQADALWTPFFSRLEKHQFDIKNARSGSRFLLLSLFVIWLLLLAAAARPQRVSNEVDVPVKARDIMLAVDISPSMEEEDMEYDNQQMNRLESVKKILGAFIKRRQGDRLGLIVFGSQAYLHAPLTFDMQTLSTYLNELQVHLAGEATAIGDAIALAINYLQHRPAEQRILILLTDGSNTGGSIEPVEAAQLAARENLKIYTLGIGSDGGTMSNVLGKFLGVRLNLGGSDVDEDTLKKVAAVTQGKYFRAKNTQELQDVYRILDTLEPIKQDSKSLKLKKSLLHWPLSLALLLCCLISVKYLLPELMFSRSQRKFKL